MSAETIRDELRAFLKKLSGVADIADGDELFARGLLNSLYAMQIVQFVESRYQLIVRDEDLELDNFQTIEAIARLIERRTRG